MDAQRLRGHCRIWWCLLVLSAVFLRVSGADAQLLNELRTEDLRLLYLEATQSYLAPHVARCFANSMEFQRTLWGWEPSEPVTVLLSDFSDRGNASAGAVPRNMLLLESSPLGNAYETVSSNERMNWLMNHELVHIAAADQAAGSDRFFRKAFQGKVAANADNPESILYHYLTAPRDAAPRWYHEGIAVFVETWMAGGIGRAQGPYDEMVFRSMVRDGSHFYDPLGLISEGTKIDFQVEVNSYLYGTRFMSYLADQHGPEEVVRWVGRGDDSRKYFAYQFASVFGQSLRDEWQSWIDWEHEFQQTNLDAIRQYPITPHEDLSDRALGSISRAFFDRELGKLIAGFNYPGVVAHVGAIAIDDGTVEKLIDIKGPVIYAVTSLAYDPGSKTVFYTTDNVDFRDLRAIDLETRKSRTLLKDARVGDLAFNPADRSLWGVRHFNGIVTLVRVPFPYEEWNRVHSWPYGQVMYDLDVSPDGRLVSASVGEISGRHTLRVWETDSLLAGDVTPVARVEIENSIPASFVFSPDGRFLYGSSSYTGVSNIVRYDLEEERLEWVSNTETGFFRPVPLDDGSLVVFRFTGDGFVPATIDPEPLEDVSAITFLGHQITEHHPVVKEWTVGSPADVALESLVKSRGDYHGFKSIGLESIYPIVEGYKDSAAVGIRANLSDPMLLNRLSLTASYTPDKAVPSDERLHLQASYERYNWRADLTLNNADFYDLFGPTKTSMKGHSAAVGYDKLLVYDMPKQTELKLDLAFYGDMERLPGYQNVESPYDKLLWAQVELAGSNMRSSLGHVDDEKGYTWEVVAANNHVESGSIPNLRGGFDFGFALPLRHSSIWLRSAAGVAFGNRLDPFANFYFGGFGNNWVDHRSVKRYREWYSFPGVDLNEIGGRNFAKTMLEWNLPPLRFRRVGWPGFHMTWARTSLFTTAIATDFDASSLRTEVGNVGVQIDLHLSVLFRLDMTLSVGYATAVEKGFKPRDEVMVSLKIL